MRILKPWERGPAGPPQARHSTFSGPAGPRSQGFSQSRAFTLIEILLALAIFAIGFAMVASVPSGATLLEKRYEQIVEGELASNNVIEMLAGRPAFWPEHECLYADGQIMNGGYSSATGTSTLDYLAFDAKNNYAAQANANVAASGQLKPLTSLNFTLNNGAESKSLDADTQGDFEDYQCNADMWPDGSWGSVVNQTEYESTVYWRTFDTNNSGTGGLYQTTGTPGAYYFTDGGDRTDFARGRIHLCHNRLTPANQYPLDVRSYPLDAPLGRRRVFVSLAYADKNTSVNGRQWQLYAVAHAKAPDDQWTEAAWAMDYYTLNVGLTGKTAAPPNISGNLTQGDVSTLARYAGTSPVAGVAWPMLANCAGLFDADASDFTMAGLPANNAFNHSYLDTLWSDGTNTNRLTGMGKLGGGAVAPLCGTSAEVVLYPTLMQLPAIIYDWENNLIQVAYPKEYVPVGGNSDRRLKVGDHFLSVEAGMQFIVKSVRNESRAQYAAADQSFFQVVEVSPGLNTTALGGAKMAGFTCSDGAARDVSGNTYPYWRLRHIYVAPAATGKTISSWSWSSTVIGDHFMSANPNQ